MKRGTSFFLSLLLVLLAADAPVKAQLFENHFVHVFNINAGSLNSSTELILHFPAVHTSYTLYTVTCHNQAGELLASLTEILLPDETITMNVKEIVNQNGTDPSGMSEDFMGSCLVSGQLVVSTSNWRIQVSNGPTVSGSDVSTSVVGQAPYASSDPSKDWALAVGEISPGSYLGVAIYNSEETDTMCMVGAVDGSGATMAGVEQVEIRIPGLGQISRFPFDSQNLVGRTISLRVTCDKQVLPLVVLQDATNGFPTPSYGLPLP